MKSVWFAIAIALSWTALAIVVAQSQAPPRPPAAGVLINEAVQTAQSENKSILILFGASWCKWCKKLDAALDSSELAKIFQDNYVVLHLTVQESEDKADSENPDAEALLAESGAGQAGIPVMLFLDPSGQRLATSLALPDGSNIGYPVAPEEIAAFEGLLLKTALHMTAEQRSTVSMYLRNHAH